MDQFARVNAGVESPADFFAPDNVERILAAAERPPGRRASDGPVAVG